jgi:hypothetical protein
MLGHQIIIMEHEDEDYGHFYDVDDYVKPPNIIKLPIKPKKVEPSDDNSKIYRYTYFERAFYILSVTAILIVFVKFA